MQRVRSLEGEPSLVETDDRGGGAVEADRRPGLETREGAHRVQVPRSEGERVEAGLAIGREHQDGLDLVGAEEGIDLEQQGGGAGDDPGRLARSGKLDAVLADFPFGVQRPERGAGGEGGDDTIARSDEVRFEHVVPVGGSTAAEGGRDVVDAGDGVAVVHRADGERVGAVPRRVDRHESVAAAISGGRDDKETGRPRAGHGSRERIGAVRLGGGMAEREVEHADSEALAVGDRPVDRLDYVARVTASLVVEDAERDEADLRCHALKRAALSGTADEAGDVGAMTEPVSRLARPGEVLRREDPRRGDRGPGSQSGVDQGHRDPSPGEAEVPEHSIRPGGRHRGVELGVARPADRPIRGNRFDRGVRGEGAHLLGAHRPEDRASAGKRAPATLAPQDRPARFRVGGGAIGDDHPLRPRGVEPRRQVRSDLRIRHHRSGPNPQNRRPHCGYWDAPCRSHFLSPPAGRSRSTRRRHGGARAGPPPVQRSSSEKGAAEALVSNGTSRDEAKVGGPAISTCDFRERVATQLIDFQLLIAVHPKSRRSSQSESPESGERSHDGA